MPQADSGRSRIAVVIVNWNAGAYLEETLAAVVGQRRPADRILVVDNASTDGSCQMVERFSGVELLRLEANVGFAAANNVGSRMASDCDWLAFLNPDAFPDVEWLERLAAAAMNYPGVTMFASELRLAASPTELDGAGDAYHVSGLAWRIGHGEAASVRDAVPREVFSPCGAAAMVRRQAFEQIGGFDPTFFCYMEDVDLAFRLRLGGHRCVYVPAAIVRHVGSGTTAPHSAFAIYHGHRNLVWTWVKNMPGYWVWVYLPQHVLLTVTSIVRFTLLGHASTILRAKWHALAGLRPILAERRRVQRERTVSARTVVGTMSHGWLTPYRTHLARRASR